MPLLSLDWVAVWTAATAFVALGVFVLTLLSYNLSREMMGRRNPIIVRPCEDYAEPLPDYRVGTLPHALQLHYAIQEKDLPQMREVSYRVYNHSQVEQLVEFTRFYVWWPRGLSYRLAIRGGFFPIPQSTGGDIVLPVKLEGTHHPARVFATISGRTMSRRGVHFRGWVPLEEYTGDVSRPLRGQGRWKPELP